MSYDNIPPEKLILRDVLAVDRTFLANERTLLAYMRTAIMLFISGITIIKLFSETPVMVVLGYGMLPVSFLVAILGSYRFRKTNRMIKVSDEKDASQLPPG
jgi:putative membrane protein